MSNQFLRTIFVAALFTLSIAIAVSFARADEPKKPAQKPLNSKQRLALAYAQVEDVPGLPRVLLIGDSISIWYTVPVRNLLKGKANVHRPPENCHATNYILKQLDTYLGDKKWDVIHFNSGGHDLTYRKDGIQGNPGLTPEEGGKLVVPLDEYKKNLRMIVARLKKTGAKVVWSTTTPMGVKYQEKKIRFEEDIVKYNAAAAEIMKAEGVPIVDLYGMSKPNIEKLVKDGVHYTDEGSEMLAKAVAGAIEKELPKKK